jgi:uncharacterized protein YcgL (UPF0745 family)
VNVVVYRSRRKPATYLYLAAGVSFDELPEPLIANFPEEESFLEFVLHETRVLALADPKKVMAALDEHGFYLQLPPAEDYEILGE